MSLTMAFICKICEKSYKYQSGVSRHGRTHRQSIIHCSCGLPFTRRDNLKRHQRFLNCCPPSPLDNIISQNVVVPTKGCSEECSSSKSVIDESDDVVVKQTSAAPLLKGKHNVMTNDDVDDDSDSESNLKSFKQLNETSDDSDSNSSDVDDSKRKRTSIDSYGNKHIRIKRKINLNIRRRKAGRRLCKVNISSPQVVPQSYSSIVNAIQSAVQKATNHITSPTDRIWSPPTRIKWNYRSTKRV
jgi:hypothetical protein